MNTLLFISPNKQLELKTRTALDEIEFHVIAIQEINEIEQSDIVPDVILLDRGLLKNQIGGYLSLLQNKFIETPIILYFPSHSDEEIAIGFRSGVFDVMSPDITDINLNTIIQRGVNKRKEWLSVQNHIEQLRMFNLNLQTKIDQLKKDVENSESFTESIMRALGAGLITFDMAGRVTYTNPSAANIFGWSTENLTGIDINNVMKIDADLGQIIDGSEYERQYECEAIRSDGKKLKIGYTLFPRRNKRNDVVEMICIFRDLFELEKIREENARLDKIATLGQIAAGIAHEVKNPLAAIQSIVQAMGVDILDDSPQKIQFDRIFKEVERINQLLENSFAFTRTKRAVTSTGNLKNTINDVLNLLEADFNKRGVVVQFTVENDLPDIRFDPNQMKQVFLNLLLNSADSMNHGGSIFISIQHKVAPKHVKGFISVKVTDTGTGIDPSNLRRIFDPFYTTKPHGTGLGLPITYKIIQDHKGKLDIESEVGKGTTFSILLPD